MKHMKNFLILMICLLPFFVLAESDKLTYLVETELSDVNIKSATVYFDGKAFKYQPEKENSLYRSDSNAESVPLDELEVGTKYFFESVYREESTMNGYAEKPVVVVFISHVRPPE